MEDLTSVWQAMVILCNFMNMDTCTIQEAHVPGTAGELHICISHKTIRHGCYNEPEFILRAKIREMEQQKEQQKKLHSQALHNFIQVP